MKYLRGFNESDNNQTNIINDCKDILLDLNDRHIKCSVWGVEGGTPYYDKIKIEVGDGNNSFKLGSTELIFEHLFSYLESLDFFLDGKDSFYGCDNWDYYGACPSCGSTNISSIEFPKRDLDKFECGICKHVGHREDFEGPEHPINKSDLMYSIKHRWGIDFMLLTFIYRKK